MKINSVKLAEINYKKQTNLNKKQNNICSRECNSINSDNYGKNFVSSNILFKAGIPHSNVPEVVAKASLLDKLTVGLNKLTSIKHILFVSSSKEALASDLKPILDEMATPFTKVLMLMIPNFPTSLAFYKVFVGTEVWNMGKKSVVVDDDILTYDSTASLKSDSLIISNMEEIDFAQVPQNTKKLESLSNYFIEEHDFQSDYSDAIDSHNQSCYAKIFDSAQKTKNSKLKEQSNNVIDFSSIGGQDHIIKEIKRNIIFPMKYPEAFSGFQMNKGAIFYGPPGTGKSLMADIISKQSGASFFKVAGAELDDKLVGESEKHWRDLHWEAVKQEPSIIFIDEMDAVARNRNGKDAYGDKVLNQILALMSEDEKEDRNIFWIGATNKLESLDSAVTRSGRFGKKYEFLPPSTKKDVEQIFNIHTKKLTLSSDLDKENIFSKILKLKATGADIKIVVDDARINAFERMEIFKSMENGTYTPDMLNYLKINNEDFMKSIDNFSKKNEKREPIGYIK